MTKRKSKRFGDSVSVHMEASNEAYLKAMDHVERADDAIDSGRCERALFALGQANEAAGEVNAHTYAAGQASVNATEKSLADLGDRINSAERTFARRCVKEAVIDRNTGRVALGTKK